MAFNVSIHSKHKVICSGTFSSFEIIKTHASCEKKNLLSVGNLSELSCVGNV